MIMKRSFAPPADRLKSLIAREKKMPALAGRGAGRTSTTRRSIFTEIAIEQIDGNIALLQGRRARPRSRRSRTRRSSPEFTKTNDAVMAALAAYKTFLQNDLLPRSRRAASRSAPRRTRKALSANEMIDLPLDELLKIAEADRQKNEAAFQATAKTIDPTKPPDAGAGVARGRPPARRGPAQDARRTRWTRSASSSSTSTSSRSRRRPRRTVKETPPFMRSTTSASMDTPGPFETGEARSASTT